MRKCIDAVLRQANASIVVTLALSPIGAGLILSYGGHMDIVLLYCMIVYIACYGYKKLSVKLCSRIAPYSSKRITVRDPWGNYWLSLNDVREAAEKLGYYEDIEERMPKKGKKDGKY